MPVKGEIPVIDERYDLTSVSGGISTAKTAVGGIVGVAMLIGVAAGGRALYNRIAREAPQLDEIETF